MIFLIKKEKNKQWAEPVSSAYRLETDLKHI